MSNAEIFLSCVFCRNFFAKSVVVSILFITFAVELERTEKNGRDEGSND